MTDEVKEASAPLDVDVVDEGVEDESVEVEEKARKRRSFKWSSLSYATRVTLSFALIAAMTALVAIGVMAEIGRAHV